MRVKPSYESEKASKRKIDSFLGIKLRSDFQNWNQSVLSPSLLPESGTLRKIRGRQSLAQLRIAIKEALGQKPKLEEYRQLLE